MHTDPACYVDDMNVRHGRRNGLATEGLLRCSFKQRRAVLLQTRDLLPLFDLAVNCRRGSGLTSDAWQDVLFLAKYSSVELRSESGCKQRLARSGVSAGTVIRLDNGTSI